MFTKEEFLKDYFEGSYDHAMNHEELYEVICENYEKDPEWSEVEEILKNTERRVELIFDNENEPADEKSSIDMKDYILENVNNIESLDKYKDNIVMKAIRTFGGKPEDLLNAIKGEYITDELNSNLNRLLTTICVAMNTKYPFVSTATFAKIQCSVSLYDYIMFRETLEAGEHSEIDVKISNIEFALSLGKFGFVDWCDLNDCEINLSLIDDYMPLE